MWTCPTLLRMSRTGRRYSRWDARVDVTVVAVDTVDTANAANAADTADTAAANTVVVALGPLHKRNCSMKSVHHTGGLAKARVSCGAQLTYTPPGRPGAGSGMRPSAPRRGYRRRGLQGESSQVAGGGAVCWFGYSRENKEKTHILVTASKWYADFAPGSSLTALLLLSSSDRCIDILFRHDPIRILEDSVSES
jgi:hypothetical protein